MNPEIDEYLYQGEGENIEFKQTLNRPYKIAKTICAFANAAGGVILVGIKDDKTISGIDPDEERHIIQEAAEFYCKPAVSLNIEEIFYLEENSHPKERVILKVQVPSSPNKPHYAQNQKGNWLPFIRQKDKTLMAGKKGLLQILQQPETEQPVKYTRNEKRLLEFLNRHEKITLKKYMNLVNISQRRARRELEEAMSKGIIRIMEHEQEDYYVR